MFTALNTVEPPIVDRSAATLLERDKPWFAERMPMLDGAFSAGDLLMVTVLRRLDGTGLVEEYPNLSAYVARGVARPAYKRAF